MASPQTCTPDNNMATSISGEHYAIISQLMTEKDRLITEKDELVVSKDRLWREMHQILEAKSERTESSCRPRAGASRSSESQLELQRLREENSDLKRRNHDLEQALRDALETDEDQEYDTLEDDCWATSAEGALEEIQR